MSDRLLQLTSMSSQIHKLTMVINLTRSVYQTPFPYLPNQQLYYGLTLVHAHSAIKFNEIFSEQYVSSAKLTKKTVAQWTWTYHPTSGTHHSHFFKNHSGNPSHIRKNKPTERMKRVTTDTNVIFWPTAITNFNYAAPNTCSSQTFSSTTKR